VLTFLNALVEQISNVLHPLIVDTCMVFNKLLMLHFLPMCRHLSCRLTIVDTRDSKTKPDSKTGGDRFY
jgi:hypothetical protein